MHERVIPLGHSPQSYSLSFSKAFWTKTIKWNLPVWIFAYMHRHLYHLAEESSLHNIFPFLHQYPKYNQAKSNFPLGKLQNAQKNIPQLKCWEVLEKHALLIFHSSPYHILLVVLHTCKFRFISDAHNECTIIKKRMTLNRSSTQSLNEVCSHFMAGSKGKSHSKKKR